MHLPCLAGFVRADLDATIMSTDGTKAFDLVSRGAMLQGLLDVSPPAVPFVRQFYGNFKVFVGGEGGCRRVGT